MSDDIRAKAQAVLSGQEGRDAYAGDLANHVLATEARLDVALRGALQSREEMREWLLESDDAINAVQEALIRRTDMKPSGYVVLAILHDLADAMPGGDA